jgi:hypothetical protein
VSKWPFLGGLIALFIALWRFAYRFLDVFGTMAEKLLLIATLLVFLSHVLHQAGAPVPDLLPFLPTLNSGPGN